MMDCIFCKIIKKEIPKEFDYEDENIVAFADIHPVRPVHILLIPKKHYEDFYNLDDSNVLFSLQKGVRKIIDEKKLLGKGFRITTNGGGAQLVDHLHFHLLSPVKSDTKL